MKIITILLWLICAIGVAQELPVRPERTIGFTVKEGSYMNLDISPDGKTLLFDLLGNLYSLPVTGGQARQLTTGIALHLKPCWMKNGKYIAYKSDKSGSMQYHVRDFIGKVDRLADSTEQKGIDGITAIRDEIVSPNGRWQARLRDTNGTRALIVQDIKDGKGRILVPSLLQWPYSYRSFPDNRFCFSSDSKDIFISYGGKIHQVNVLTGTNQVIPFTARVQNEMGKLVYHQYRLKQEPFQVRYTRSANRNPNGQFLVYSALNRIYRKTLPQGEPVLFNDQNINQFQPACSPDGQQVAYVSWADTTGGHLWVAKRDGSQPRQLTTVAGNYQHPVWSPDGKYLAVIKGKQVLPDRDDPGEGQLQLIDVANNQVTILQEKVSLWNQLTFSVDGKQLYFQPAFETSLAGQSVLLSSVTIDGKKHNGAIVAKSNDRNIKQRSISPDGRFMVVSWCEDIYLASLANKRTPVDFDFLQLIRVGLGLDPIWEQGGKVLTWSYGNTFYQIDPDHVLQDRNTKPAVIANLSFKVPAYYGKGTLALTNARIITMKGKQIIPKGTILIRNGRIAAIGSSNTVTIPIEATIKDMQGTTIMPGMVDLHLHMRFSPDIFPQQSWMTRANLAYGVTTGRDPSSNYDAFGYGELLASGSMTGPRLITVGRAARMGDGFARLDSLGDALALAGKRHLLGGMAIKQYLLDTRLKRQWMLQASAGQGLNMTNEGCVSPMEQIGMLKDGSTGIEHNPAWGDVYEDVIRLYARSGTWITPALQVTHGLGMSNWAKEYMNHKYWNRADAKMKRFLLSDTSQKGPTSNGAESLETILSAAPTDTVEKAWLAPARINARFYHAGGRIALGSHGNDQGIGAHNELWALQEGGLTNMEALHIATLSGAEALGLQRDIGSLEKGKIADLIILNSNPLDDIHNSRDIRYVMKDGILYDGDTLDELWPNKKKAPVIAR